MKTIDIIFAIICGMIIAWLADDFSKGYGVALGFYRWILLIFLPIISLICLLLAELIGKKILFIFQAAKYFLVGALVTVLDLKIFEFLFWMFFPFLPASAAMASKTISFLSATVIKYWGNKYWAFEKNGKENLGKEIIKFFIVTLIGLIIDIGFFFYFTIVLGPSRNKFVVFY
ncbi:MAG: GtrA family protein [Parcubacteria group bacterium Licking1014_1]|nr:MAG: GtrA family protein [Parcubacteria group bacterium Licking1014_1]